MFQSRQMTRPVSDKDVGRWALGKGALQVMIVQG